MKNQNKNFSETKYYILISGLLVFPLVWGLADSSFLPVAVFIIFGLAGMFGEILFSEWWRSFYEQPFYRYAEDKIVYGYSSTLNFIPWAFGGLLVLGILHAVDNYWPVLNFSFAGSELYTFFVSWFFAGFALQFMARAVLQYFHPYSFKFKKISALNYLLFCLPFILAVMASGIVFGYHIIFIALIFGIVIAMLEYLFGKVLQFMLGRRLWVYLLLSFDDGHFTPLAIIPFSMVGFYFWMIYGLFSMVGIR